MSEATPLWSKGSEDRPEKLIPERVTYIDEEGHEVPLYHFFLKSSEGVALDPDHARMHLSELIAQDADLILRCQGKSYEEVRRMLAH